ncbi:MAG: benzoate-CoA ligase family protein [Chloroflexi bacterium]|nr:benzoate-CoA ligase family protein [Chloroflexota bacterium]
MSAGTTYDLRPLGVSDSGALLELPETFNMSTVLLDRHLEAGFGGRPAVFYEGGTLSYDALSRLANRAGNALRSLGLRREERVVLLLPDCPEFLAVFLGAMRLGAVPVPVNTVSSPADYAYYLNDSRAAVVVVDQELLPRLEPIRSGLRSLRSVVVLGEAPPGCVSLQELLAHSSDELAPAGTHRDEPSYWLYSSGTTGRPKGVVHLHHDMVYCVEPFARHGLGLTPEDRTFSVPRLFFSYGLVNSLYMPLYVGASAVLARKRPDPAGVLEALARFRPTVFCSVPTFYVALLRYLESLPSPLDLGSLRLAISGGEPLPAPLCVRWQERTGLELLDVVGSTEVGYIYISNRPGRVRPGASGELVPGYEARVVDEDEQPVPRGTVGDLWIKGESVAACYWNKHARTKRAFAGEWLRTGDKFHQDVDGYFYYFGRGDDLLKVSAQWVSPMEVEGTLLAHPAVAECAVVGALDSEGLLKPKAFVSLQPGYAPSAELAVQLQEFARAHLPPFKRPAWIEFVAEFPKTPTGKIERYRLRSGG